MTASLTGLTILGRPGHSGRWPLWRWRHGFAHECDRGGQSSRGSSGRTAPQVNRPDGGNAGPGGVGQGGGIDLAGGSLTLNHDDVSDNLAEGGDGGLGGAAGNEANSTLVGGVGGSGGAGQGGGIYLADGLLALNGDDFTGNFARRGNGGLPAMPPATRKPLWR